METKDKLLRIADVEKRTGLGKSLLYKLLANGSLPSVVIAGTRCRRVSEFELDAWIADEVKKSKGDLARESRPEVADDD